MLRSQITRMSLVFFAFVFGIILPTQAFATEYRAGNHVRITPDDVIDGNLYVAARKLTVDGHVTGDLIALVGGKIRIAGYVDGKIIALGQSLTISGHIGDDILFAGQKLQMMSRSHIIGDVICAGYELKQKPQGQLDGEIIFFAEEAILGGEIAKDVKGRVSSIEFEGTIKGDVDLSLTSRTAFGSYYPFSSNTRPIDFPLFRQGLVVSNTAWIKGNLYYRGLHEAIISPKALIEGQTVHKGSKIGSKMFNTLVYMGKSQFRRFLTYFMTGSLLMWLVPYWVRRLSDTVNARPLRSFVGGFLTLFCFALGTFLIPVLTIALTVLLSPISVEGTLPIVITIGILAEIIFVSVFLAFITIVPTVVISYLIGRWLLAKINPDWAVGRARIFIVGLLLFMLITSIPFVGLFINPIVTLLVLGALWILRTSTPYYVRI